MLDSRNPLSEMFKVRNGGYIPVTDLDADCAASFSVGGNIFDNAHFGYPSFAADLAHDGTVTIPCFSSIDIGNRQMTGAGIFLNVEIGYAYYHLNLPKLRRSQLFRFMSVAAKDGTYHWIFLG